MSTTMTALNSANIQYAEFVRMVVGKAPTTTTYTFCNAAAAITVDGITFAGLGSFLGVGQVERNIKSTSTDMMVSLTGIDPANVAIILGANIKGSTVEIWRGFLDSDNQIITSPTQQFFKRYTGIINSVSITEDWNEQLRSRIATCSVSCTSMKRVLENYVAACKTSKTTWQARYPNDTSMDRVDAISNTNFDFGKPPQGGGVSGGRGGGGGVDSEIIVPFEQP